MCWILTPSEVMVLGGGAFGVIESWGAGVSALLKEAPGRPFTPSCSEPGAGTPFHPGPGPPALSTVANPSPIPWPVTSVFRWLNSLEQNLSRRVGADISLRRGAGWRTSPGRIGAQTRSPLPPSPAFFITSSWARLKEPHSLCFQVEMHLAKLRWGFWVVGMRDGNDFDEILVKKGCDLEPRVAYVPPHRGLERDLRACPVQALKVETAPGGSTSARFILFNKAGISSPAHSGLGPSSPSGHRL